MAALKDLTDAQAGWGTIRYNGFQFPGLREVKISGQQVYDEAERTVSHTRYTLEILCYVYASSEANSATGMINLRNRLSKPGQSLIINDIGFGDVRLNPTNSEVATYGSQTHRDVEWGPKPEITSCVAIGTIAHEITWRCTFSIKECNSSAAGQILAYNHEIVWSVSNGFTTRVISGYLQIAQTRTNGGRTLAATAMGFRDRIKAPVPTFFERTNATFSLSKNKNRLDFVIIDRQLEGFPPLPGLDSETRIDYDIESVPPGFQQFVASIGGELVVAPGRHPGVAAQAAVTIILDKWTKLRQAVPSDKGAVIPTKIRFGHTIGTRRSRFSIAYLVTHCLDDLLKSGGIWSPIEGATYPAWAQSMAEVWRLGGTANLIYTPSSDAIVDLCDATALPVISTGEATGNPVQFSGSAQFGSTDVPKSASWLGFENTLKAERVHSHSAHKPASLFSIGKYNIGWSGPGVGNLADRLGVSHAPIVNEYEQNKDILQVQGQPTDYLLMYGKALRIQHEPAIPRLVAINGNKRIIEVKSVIDGPRPVACIFGKVVYLARWAIRYRVTGGYLGPLAWQENPALCCLKDE